MINLLRPTALPKATQFVCFVFFAVAMPIGLQAQETTGYQEGPVMNGGSIEGVVIFKGDIPEDERRPVTTDNEQCGETVAAEKFVISSAGGVRWAVAMLDDIGSGKPLDRAQDITMDNKDCHFVPHVLVGPKGGNLKVGNSDPMLHNSHFFLMDGDKRRNVLNVALPKQDLVVAKKKILRKAGLLSVRCDAHDFMQAYVWSLPHPYGAVTDVSGAFAMEDVPAGSYTLRVWHEALGEKEIPVTVSGGQAVTVSIEYP